MNFFLDFRLTKMPDHGIIENSGGNECLPPAKKGGFRHLLIMLLTNTQNLITLTTQVYQDELKPIPHVHQPSPKMRL